MSSIDEKPNSYPPRLHVLMAREAPYAVVIRLGPAKRACFVGWDRSTDEFTLGQWLKGRIDKTRSDISPDGRHVIYFADKGRAWTAISRAPYLKAIGLWKQGDQYCGGGLFKDNTHYWLSTPPYGGFTDVQLPKNLFQTDSPDNSYVEGECFNSFHFRLKREGWRFIFQEKRRGGHIEIFEKDVFAGWTLRKIYHPSASEHSRKQGDWEEHELENFGEVLTFPDWEWADVDRKRLVWAEKGSLFAGRLTQDGLKDIKELYNFSKMTFEEIKAPY